MDVKVKFLFEDSDFGEGFEIINPPVVPVKGDHLEFEWENYVSDWKKRELIEAFEEDHDFVADILQKSYSPKEVIVTVLLRTDTNYENDEKEELTGVIRSAQRR